MMDLNDAHSIDELIAKEKPDYFINFGASAFVPDSWNSPAACMETNAIALIHILESVRKHNPKCRVYSAGSSEQWGDVKYSPQDEKHPMSPRSIYGVSKCAASLICKIYRESYNLFVIHGILTNHEGLRRQYHYVSRKITSNVARIYHKAQKDQNFEPLILGQLDAKRDWSDSRDFMRGVWSMINQSEPNEYILSSNETHSVREFCEISFREAGFSDCWWEGEGVNEKYFWKNPQGEKVVLVSVSEKFYRPADVMLLQGDSTLARKNLGWIPEITFNQMVKDMVMHDIELYKS
jgi:GDPmannose 4,6-dehydratase